jgi:KUP system potassium uptake protein
VGLFAIQSRGTGVMGRFFGPITTIWFITMGALGATQIMTNPAILQALSPVHAVSFMIDHHFLTFIVLGSVFLAVTGAEALYADMGHFGRRPIRTAWIGLVLPALTLNYLGQGAFVIANLDRLNQEYRTAADAARAVGANTVQFDFSPFFEMAPDMFRLPLVILATAATVIASQAVISGAFSLTQQAIQLGLLPRMEIRRTSETQAGQIYMPQVNTLVLIGVLFLVALFQSSSKLATAYGIAVTGTMIVTACLAFIVVWRAWGWPRWAAALLIAPFLVIDLIFFGANALKLFEGGFVPLMIAALVMIVMWTWTRSAQLVFDKTRREEAPIADLARQLAARPPQRVKGTAVFLTADPEIAPPALMHSLKHYKVLHEKNVLLTVKVENAPRVDEARRARMEEIDENFSRVFLTFGYMEEPNVPKALALCRKQGWKFDIMSTSFFLSRRVIRAAKDGRAMPLWQDRLFISLAQNASDTSAYFYIPTNRVVEIGTQVSI